jgi:preprotein translocase subunit SecD
MRTVKELLQEADPLENMTNEREDLEARDRIRRTVLAARAQAGPRATTRWLSAAIAVTIVVMAVGVWRFSTRESAGLQAAVRFEVRLAETQPGSGLREARIAGSNDVVYLHADPVVTNEDISESRVIARDDRPDRFSVVVSFTAAGGEKMRRATTEHMGKPMAIIVDGEVVAAPTVRSAISSEAMLTGNYTKAEAERIANGMRLR